MPHAAQASCSVLRDSERGAPWSFAVCGAHMERRARRSTEPAWARGAGPDTVYTHNRHTQHVCCAVAPLAALLSLILLEVLVARCNGLVFTPQLGKEISRLGVQSIYT